MIHHKQLAIVAGVKWTMMGCTFIEECIQVIKITGGYGPILKPVCMYPAMQFAHEMLCA
jgi:hypothetical protein